jgi:hypothetical protein
MDYHTDAIVDWKKDNAVDADDVAQNGRWIAKELICTDGTVWIVRDMAHEYNYYACAGALGAAVLVDDLNAAGAMEARQ